MREGSVASLNREVDDLGEGEDEHATVAEAFNQQRRQILASKACVSFYAKFRFYYCLYVLLWIFAKLIETDSDVRRTFPWLPVALIEVRGTLTASKFICARAWAN